MVGNFKFPLSHKEREKLELGVESAACSFVIIDVP